MQPNTRVRAVTTCSHRLGDCWKWSQPRVAPPSRPGVACGGTGPARETMGTQVPPCCLDEVGCYSYHNTAYYSAGVVRQASWGSLAVPIYCKPSSVSISISPGTACGCRRRQNVLHAFLQHESQSASEPSPSHRPASRTPPEGRTPPDHQHSPNLPRHTPSPMDPRTVSPAVDSFPEEKRKPKVWHPRCVLWHRFAYPQHPLLWVCGGARRQTVWAEFLDN